LQLKKFDSINVVPFIDIMLVLLVIVLITATFVVKGFIPLELPVAKTSLPVQNQENITISIKKNGEIYINKMQVDMEKLDAKLLEYSSQTSIYINSDKEAKFDFFVNILDILNAKGYKNLAIMTQTQTK